MASHPGQGADRAGQSAGDPIKKGWATVHGAGEAIRGNINTFADSVAGTDSTKDRNVAARGEAEMDTGRYAGTGAGVTPKDTGREKINRALQGETDVPGGTHGSAAAGVGPAGVAGSSGGPRV